MTTEPVVVWAARSHISRAGEVAAIGTEAGGRWVAPARPGTRFREGEHAFDEFESKTWSARAKGRGYLGGSDKAKD